MPDGRVDLGALLKALHARGRGLVLLEGGPTLAGAFVRAGLVDRVVAYLAPTLLGAGVASLAGTGIGTLADGVRLEVTDVTRCGPDVRVQARPVRGNGRGGLMFTGIVEELGEVVALTDLGDSVRLTLRGPTVVEDAAHGDSIAVNGVCLTVVDATADGFTADVMRETLDRSCLGALAAGDPVNLERPMRLDGRLGGHLVQGHVDGTGTILERRRRSTGRSSGSRCPTTWPATWSHKGSVTVDGVSLTVASLADESFTVSLIPTTLELTTLGRKQVGDPVNLEVDVVAKYVERLLASRTDEAPSAPRRRPARERPRLAVRGPAELRQQAHPVAGDHRQRLRAGVGARRHAAQGLGLAGRHRRQRAAVHRVHRRGVRQPAAGEPARPGRPPGDVHRGVASTAGTAGQTAQRRRLAGRRPALGVVARAGGSSCSSRRCRWRC